MIHLTRVDPARNMARFYALHLAPGLFGDWTLVKEWGRIGQGGTLRTETFTDAGAARTALEQAIARKLRRGYCSYNTLDIKRQSTE